MILRSFFSSKCSFEHIECSPDNPNERKIFRQKSRSHSLSVRKRWKGVFSRYNHHQIFLVELGNAVLTTLRKTFLLKFKRFRSLYEISSSFFFKTSPPKCSFGANIAFSTSFLKNFGQQTGKLLFNQRNGY